MHLHRCEAKLPNLKLKSQPGQLSALSSNVSRSPFKTNTTEGKVQYS
jgi:hypothetical protein